MTILKPLAPYEIRDLKREMQGRLSNLKPMKELVIVKSFKKGKCYGIGLNDPKKDLIMRNFQRLLAGVLRPKPSSDTYTTVSLTDTGGVTRTPSICSDVSVFNRSTNAPLAVLGTMLGFGNPATAPTPARTDYELASLVSTITPSSTTSDETNWRLVVTGSYVWTAGGTVRETGMYGNFCYASATWTLFLLYHDAVSDVVVPAGGTVSVTYTTQF